jgi:predicted PurR-regulated permease PerM
MTIPDTPRPSILLARLGALWLGYIKGQFLLSLILGGITWTVGAAIGLSWALPLGFFAGLLGTVPSVGALLAAIPAVIVALWKGSSVFTVQNWVFALVVAGAYLLIQQASSLFLEPRILGQQLRLSPWIVLLGVIAGGLLGGILGAYLAVPIIASLREITETWWRSRRA